MRLYSPETQDKIIRTHVEAERERCAKIAEGIAGTISAHWKYPEAIAKAIRAQASPPSQD